jgi:hypothetical protein
MGRYPRRNQFGEIIGRVGTDGGLDSWRRIVKAWKLHGYNPYNVAGMLECFEDGRIPGTGGCHGSTRRRSRREGRGGAYTPDDLDAAIEEARREIARLEARGELTEEERAILAGRVPELG